MAKLEKANEKKRVTWFWDRHRENHQVSRHAAVKTGEKLVLHSATFVIL